MDNLRGRCNDLKNIWYQLMSINYISKLVPKLVPKTFNFYNFICNQLILLCRCAESNCGPFDYESIALPTELQRHKEKYT